MKSAAEIEADSWDELYAMEDGEPVEPPEPCGCQDWNPEKTEELPTQKPAPVAENPLEDDRCFSCGTVEHGNGHYCGSRGYV